MSVDRLRLGVVRIGVSVLVAGAVVGVAGCTGKDPAPTSTTSSTTTTSPPTTTTSPPPTTDLPAAAKAHTSAGAEAFVRYFNDQVSKAWMTPDASVIPPLCLPTAKACAGFQAGAVQLVTDKQHLDRASLTIQQLVQSGDGPDGSVRFEMHGQQTDANVLDAKNAVVSKRAGKPASFVYYVLWTPPGWRIQEIKAGI